MSERSEQARKWSHLILEAVSQAIWGHKDQRRRVAEEFPLTGCWFVLMGFQTSLTLRQDSLLVQSVGVNSGAV